MSFLATNVTVFVFDCCFLKFYIDKKVLKRISLAAMYRVSQRRCGAFVGLRRRIEPLDHR